MAISRLRYLLDEQSPHGVPELTIDIESAPGYMLFFSCFMGDVDFSLDGVEFGTKVGWVSTLGFALAFHRVVDELPIEGESKVNFQEDSAWIGFKRSRDQVRVSCSYMSSEKTIEYGQLRELSKVGLGNLLETLYSRFPGLERNSALRDSLSQVNLL